MAASLKERSSAAVLAGLGEAATGIFTCGGALQTPSTVQLNYLNTAGQWNGATFPGVTGDDFQQLLKSAKVASFGIGSETVTDKRYRDAYVLDPHQFLTSFQLCETDILKEIQSLLVPDVLNVRAELYKMNIYTIIQLLAGASRLIDTPRGGKMFGSLVVCLPSQFSGGALVTRHNGQEIAYDWSSTCNDPLQKVQWAAFYSDVEHEILCVEGGHRVTLTYNLYRCDGPLLQLSVNNYPFYGSLKKALHHPHFLRSGGTLGFPCQHSYAISKLEESPESSPLYLKGSDRTLMLAAKSLGLKVQAKVLYDYQWDYNEDQSDQSDVIDCANEEFKLIEECVDEVSLHVYIPWKYRRSNVDLITWCQKVDWKLLISSRRFDDDNYEATIQNLYRAVAILVDVPKWTERKQY